MTAAPGCNHLVTAGPLPELLVNARCSAVWLCTQGPPSGLPMDSEVGGGFGSVRDFEPALKGGRGLYG